eukprot:2972547-Pyramimonas_sp.AAC.1
MGRGRVGVREGDKLGGRASCLSLSIPRKRLKVAMSVLIAGLNVFPRLPVWLKAIGSRAHATSTGAFTSQGARGDGCPGGMVSCDPG